MVSGTIKQILHLERLQVPIKTNCVVEKGRDRIVIGNDESAR